MSFSFVFPSIDARSAKPAPKRWSSEWLDEFFAQSHEDLLAAVSALAAELDALAKTDYHEAFMCTRALNRSAREHLRKFGILRTNEHPVLEETHRILEPYERELAQRVSRPQRMSGGRLNQIYLEGVLGETHPGLARQAANSSPKVAFGIFLGQGLITREEYEREEVRAGRLWTYQGT